MRDIPVVRNNRLRLDNGDVIAVGTQAWFEWLQSASIFVVDQAACRFTMRCEHSAHGTRWYAYRRNRGVLRRVFVGRTDDITGARLERIAGNLAQAAHQSSYQQRVRQQSAPIAPPSGLLATKLLTPPLRPLLIERSLAISRLQQALEFPLTVLSAPTGYGKATLLAQWIAAAQLRVAWVTLDADDSDPTRFWTYVVTALEPLVPGLTRLMLPAIQASTPQLSDADLAALINLIAAVQEPVILVLDDYHTIGTATTTVHDDLRFIVDHLPGNAHIIIASRSDPPLALARLRAHGKLNELHTADLQLTSDEAARFLTRTLGVIMPPAEIARLYHHIEGWITGWQLAALSFQGRDDIAGLARSFDGRNPYIVDFLAAEVLHNLPREQLQFLLQTAIVERVNASLCDAITQRTDSQAMLAEFERDHLFLEPLDDDHQWYRYHAIFAEALRLLGRQAQPAQLPDCYRRASHWYLAQGDNDAAVAAIFFADDPDEAARIIATIAPQTLIATGTTRLEQWLSQLPEAARCRHPILAVTHAYSLLFNGQFKQCEQQVIALERSWQPHHTAWPDASRAALQGEIIAICAAMAALRGDQLQCVALAQQAQSTLQAQQAWHFPAQVTLGIAHWLNGDGAMAAQLLDEVRRQSEQQGNAFYYFTSAAYLARVLIQLSRLREADAVCYAAAHHPQAADFPRESAAVATYLGVVLTQRNELEAAIDHLEHCLAQPQSLVSMADGACALAGARHTKGDVANAEQPIEAIQATMLAPEPFATSLVAAHHARLCALHGDGEAADAWAAEHRDAARTLGDNAPHYLRVYERLTLAQIALRQGHFEDVLELTTPLLTTTADQQTRHTIEALNVAALAHAARHETAKAAVMLRRALLIAAPEGNIQAFRWGGAGMKNLLLTLRATPELLGETPIAGRLLVFIDRLLDALGTGKAAQPTHVMAHTSAGGQHQRNQPVVASLSAREREVLRLLAGGASNQELAQTLVIEMGTVKRHLSNIYTKLGVESRAHAIARAHALGLLGS